MRKGTISGGQKKSWTPNTREQRHEFTDKLCVSDPLVPGASLQSAEREHLRVTVCRQSAHRHRSETQAVGQLWFHSRCCCKTPKTLHRCLNFFNNSLRALPLTGPKFIVMIDGAIGRKYLLEFFFSFSSKHASM